MRLTKLFVFVFVFLLFSHLSNAGYFYLSTEKSFTEADKARIKIESFSTPLVNVRLYKIPDPESFVKARKNINRVFIESEYIRSNPTELLLDYINITKSSIRDYFRKKVLNDEARENAAEEIYRELLSTTPVKSKVFIGVIKEYQLIKEFEKKLDDSTSWTYTYIDFGNLKRGLYLAEIFSKNSIAYTLVHVSDMAIVVKKSDTKLLIRSVDKKTGKGIKSKISIYDFSSGKVIGEGDTSDEGIFEFKVEKNKYSELLVYSKSNGDFSFYKISFYPVAEVERLVYLYTDSPIYKHGNKVFIKGIIRDYKNSVYHLPNVSSVKVSILNPRGDMVYLPNAKVSEFGSFESEYEIGENYPTGIYKVVVSIDKKSYVGEFKVEDYVKPKFKVSVIPDKSVVVGDKAIKVKVKAEYFTGFPVSRAEITYSIFRTPLREDIFESKKDIFEDPSYSSKIEFLDSKNAELNDKGEFEFTLSPSKYKIDRDYAFIIKAQVRDKSMATGTDTSKVKVVKTEFFVKGETSKSVYLPGEEIRVSVRLIYPDGTPVAKRKISYKAMLEDGNVVVSEGEVVSDQKGYATIKFKGTGKGFVKIKITAKDSFGNLVEENIYTWIGEEGATFVYTSGDITIAFDKKEYKVGEKAKVLVVSPVSYADAIVSTEREDIFSYSIQKFRGNTLLLDLPIDSKFAPNFYFSVLYVFNNEVYENSVKVKVPPVHRVLDISITPSKSLYSPREEGEIYLEVKDSKGNPVEAEVSVSVVNEALYQLSPEIFPDIRLFFYPYRWNSVMTLNSIALRFYGYSRMLKSEYAMKYYNKKLWDFEDFLNGQGSRYAGMKELQGKERFIFRDQILWEGKVKTDKSGKAKVQITFPDNITEWRIVAVAITKDTKVGKQTAFIKTFKELFVDINLPENVSLLDRVKGYIKVFNYSSEGRSVNVSMAVENGKLEFSNQAINIPSKGEKVLSFNFTPNFVGKAKFRVEAISEDKSDILVHELNVLPTSFEKIHSEVKVIRSPSDKLSYKIPTSVVDNTVDIQVNLSKMDNPFDVVVRGLKYLKSYPYGCVEQTTSSFLPNLVAFEISKKLNINLPIEFQDKDIILERALKALYGYKNSDGGWGWWNEGTSDVFMTAYVLYALNFVKNNYPEKLRSEIYEDGVRALESLVKDRYVDDNSQIYALYVLSECGVPFKSMVEKVSKKDLKSPYFLSLLALAAKNVGLDDIAKDTAEKLDKMATPSGLGAHWKFDEHYWYGSEIVSTSAAVRALMKLKPNSENISKGIAFLITMREGNRWRSTRETAEALFAISEFVGSKTYKKSQETNITVYLNSKEIGTLTFEENHYKNMIKLPEDAFAKGRDHSISFNVKGKFYVADIVVRYYTDEKNIKKESYGISINKKYYKVVDKKSIVEVGSNPSVRVGDTILVELNVSSKDNLEFVVIEDSLPAGFLPITKVNEYNLGIDFYRNTAHVEFRKNRCAIFLRKLVNGKYYYLMQAVYPGSFYVLPALGYEMYRPEIRGNTESARVEVVE